MAANPVSKPSVSERLTAITNELEQVEQLLLSEPLSSEVLSDFRDVVNRVRTTAWAVAQVIESGSQGRQTADALSLLANERVRVAYRLCRLIDGDLANGSVSPGKLVQLYLAARDLAQRISGILGRGEDQKNPSRAAPSDANSPT